MSMTFDLESKWQQIMAFHMAACLCGLQSLCCLPPEKKAENGLNSKRLLNSVAKGCHQMGAEVMSMDVEKNTQFIK